MTVAKPWPITLIWLKDNSAPPSQHSLHKEQCAKGSQSANCRYAHVSCANVMSPPHNMATVIRLYMRKSPWPHEAGTQALRRLNSFCSLIQAIEGIVTGGSEEAGVRHRLLLEVVPSRWKHGRLGPSSKH